jgi:hypothetical protein
MYSGESYDTNFQAILLFDSLVVENIHKGVVRVLPSIGLLILHVHSNIIVMYN